jgi:hypothetical protein
MKKTKTVDEASLLADDLQSEYQFDYRKARPNRFAERIVGKPIVVTLDPDVSQVFKTAQSVNNVLRALIASMPKSS